MNGSFSALELSANKGFNNGVFPVPVLDVRADSLLSFKRGEIKDMISQHYARIMPRALDLRGGLVLEDELYTLWYASGRLYKTMGWFGQLASKGKLHLELKENEKGKEKDRSKQKYGDKYRIRGYEIIRMSLKPKDEVPTIDSLCKIFFISKEIARRLSADVISLYPGEGIRKPYKAALNGLFDEIFPMYGKERYHYLKILPQNHLLDGINYARSA